MKSYYFTFGCGHPLRSFVQRVFASSESEARETMIHFYADRWAFCYGPFIAKYGDAGRLEKWDPDPLDSTTGIVDLHGYKYRKIGMDLMEGETL